MFQRLLNIFLLITVLLLLLLQAHLPSLIWKEDIYTDAVASWRMDGIRKGAITDEKDRYKISVFSGLGMGKGRLQGAVYLNGVDSYLQTPLTFNGWPEERCALQLDNSTQTVDWHYAGGTLSLNYHQTHGLTLYSPQTIKRKRYRPTATG